MTLTRLLPYKFDAGTVMILYHTYNRVGPTLALPFSDTNAFSTGLDDLCNLFG